MTAPKEHGYPYPLLMNVSIHAHSSVKDTHSFQAAVLHSKICGANDMGRQDLQDIMNVTGVMCKTMTTTTTMQLTFHEMYVDQALDTRCAFKKDVTLCDLTLL